MAYDIVTLFFILIHVSHKNSLITSQSQCPMDPMVAWETKDGEE